MPENDVEFLKFSAKSENFVKLNYFENFSWKLAEMDVGSFSPRSRRALAALVITRLEVSREATRADARARG